MSKYSKFLTKYIKVCIFMISLIKSNVDHLTYAAENHELIQKKTVDTFHPNFIQ